MKTGYDIIIQAGQSNAQGCGVGDMQNAYVENDDVLYYVDDFEYTDNQEKCNDGTGFWVAPAKERGNGEIKVNNFALSFAEEYVKNGLLEKGRKLLIIRAAVGGTGFRDKRWGRDDDLFKRLLKVIECSKKLTYGENDHRFVAFLWHQGEAEVVEGATYENHYNNLKYLVECVRNTAGSPNLPFIAGDFVPEWKNGSEQMQRLTKIIVDAMIGVCNDLQPAGFAFSDGLLSNRQNPSCPQGSLEDNIHFCREACAELGKRYFAKFIELVK